MNYLDVLLHPTLIMASLIYATMAISFEFITPRFLHQIGSVSSSHWIVRHIGIPFVHVLLLVAFIYMTYPVLYGLDDHNAQGEQVLPTLTQLLNAKSGQTMKIVNTLFIVSVLLPLIPVIKRFIALILPLQAIAGSAVLYGWLANFQGIEYNLLPQPKVLLMIIVASVVADLLAKIIANFFVQHHNAEGQSWQLEKVIQKSALLIFQVPILLIYTINLNYPGS